MTPEDRKPKTVKQIVDEYRNRQEYPEFLMILFENGRTYHNITNFHMLSEFSPMYEFDSEWNGKKTHVEVNSRINTKEAAIAEAATTRIIAKFCDEVFVRAKHRGLKEFYDVRNLWEDAQNTHVHFDLVAPDGILAHMRMNGRIESFISTPKGSDKVSTKRM